MQAISKIPEIKTESELSGEIDQQTLKLKAYRVQEIALDIKKYMAEGCTLSKALKRYAEDSSLPEDFLQEIVRNFNDNFCEKRTAPLIRGFVPLTDSALETVSEHLKYIAASPSERPRISKSERELRKEVYLTYRLRKICEVKCIYNEEFDAPGAQKIIMADMPQGLDAPLKPPGYEKLHPYLARLYDVPILTPDQEVHLFRKFNFLRYEIVQGRKAINFENPDLAGLRILETKLSQSLEVMEKITRHNLRLAVLIAKEFCSNDRRLMFEMISDMNMHLINAIKNFDYGQGNKFSSYAVFCMRRNQSRVYETDYRQLERYTQGCDTDVDKISGSKEVSGVVEEELLNTQTKYEVEISMALECLNQQEKEMLEQRYGLNGNSKPLTYKGIGKLHGTSREWTRRLLEAAEDKLMLRLAASSIMDDSLQDTFENDLSKPEYNRLLNKLRKLDNNSKKIIHLLWHASTCTDSELSTHLTNPQELGSLLNNLCKQKIITRGVKPGGISCYSLALKSLVVLEQADKSIKLAESQALRNIA